MVNPAFVANKMHALGIRGSLNKWVVSFLSNRKFVVKNGSAKTDVNSLQLGTPQGSVLGPLIFLLYVNDLPDYISFGKTFMYADDTSIIVSDKNIDNLHLKIKVIIQDFTLWCSRNNLILNVSKTVLVEFYPKFKSPVLHDIIFAGQNIPKSTDVKFLGLHINNNFDWSNHINELCSKLNQNFFAILNLKSNFSLSALMSTYYGLVYHTLSFHILTWGQARDFDRVLTCQKRIIRLVFGLSPRESCRRIFKENRILTVTSIYLYKLLCYMYTNKSQFKLNGDHHQYHTRKKNDLKTPGFKHFYFKKSVYYAGPKYFNLLLSDIRQARTLTIFKRNLKTFLFQHSFYSLEEFTNQCKLHAPD